MGFIKNAFLIFSGNNPRAVLSFCRFCRANDIPFYLISSGKDDFIYLTEYKEFVVYERNSRNLSTSEIIKVVEKIRAEKLSEKIVVLPSSEYLNRFLLKNKAFFEAKSILVPLVDEDIYTLVSDKFRFSELCKKFNLKVPREFDLAGIRDYPLVIKPKVYAFENKKLDFKPKIIKSSIEMDAWLEINRGQLSKYYFQEFVDGNSIYLLFYISSDPKNHVKFAQRNQIQQPDGGSMIAAFSTDHYKLPIADHYINLLDKIGFKGLIMIELKENNDQYYMIEANPRLWGPSQLFVDANVPIFENFAEDCGFKLNRVKNEVYRESKYFWFGGFLQCLKKGDFPVFHNYDRHSFFIEDFSDWMNNDVYKRKDSLNAFLSEI